MRKVRVDAFDGEVNGVLPPKKEPSLSLVAMSPASVNMSTTPSWMKYILVPAVPSLMM